MTAPTIQTRPLVLLVDDNETLRRLHSRQLDRMGFEVATAGDGAEGLALARESPPDVILCDVLMPGMDGFQLVAAVREDRKLRRIPVVLITGKQTEDADLRMAERVGAQALVRRTADLEGIAEALHAAMAGGVPKGAGAEAADALDEDYSSRFLSQLEREADANLGLTQRVTLQAAALNALAAIADALSRQVDIETATKEVLRRCVDAAGLSRAAVLLRRADGGLTCASQIGFDRATLVELEAFVADHRALDRVLSGGMPVTLAPRGGDIPVGRAFLERVAASSALVAPISSAGERIGALLLTSATRILGGEDWTAFAHTIASQLGQAVALRRAFDRLEQSEKRYRTLFETVNLVVLGLNAAGVVDYINPFFLDLTGYAREEVLGKTWLEFLPAAGREAMRAVFAELLEHEHHTHHQNPIVTRAGAHRMIAWHNTVLRDGEGRFTGTLSIGEDITERLGAEVTLRESEERFRQIADNIQELFFITDVRTGTALYVSPAYQTIWGRSCESACAAPYAWAEGIHPEDLERVRAESRSPQIDPEGTVSVFRVVHPDGAVRWVRSRVFPVLDAAGTLQRRVGVTEDITELRQAERKLVQAQKMEAVGQLAGGIAHDFNNLLAAISVFTELAGADMAKDDRRRDDLEQVQVAVARATTLTRQLLAFSRQQVLQPKVLDPNTIVVGVEKMLTRLIGEDIEMVTQLDPAAGSVRADAGQLEQVLLNLAVNARDAMRSGGRLTMATGSRRLDDAAARAAGLSRAGRYVVLTVTDTGSGMSAETKARAFEPFYTTKGGKGTGLGLATVHGIVTQSGGHIDISSEPGQGCTFTIMLPAVDPEPVPAAASAEAAPAGGAETILLVEDEAAVRMAAAAVLRRHGYTVLVAKSGAEALEMVKHQNGTIHLVLTDVVMPGMDGRELLEQLRAVRPGLKVILSSGYAGDTIARHSNLDPAIPFLPKPFTATTLAQKVRDVLDAD